MSRHDRPKDGVFTKFVGPVMSEIVRLVPDFESFDEASTFYTKLLRKRRVKAMLAIRFPNPDFQPSNHLSYDHTNHAYFCWWQAENGPSLSSERQNPLEVLHLFAHIVQPPDSAMHRGEFGKIFLALVESVYDADMKRAVKDILLAHNIKTTALSDATRARQSNAYHKRKTNALIGRFVDPEEEAEQALAERAPKVSLLDRIMEDDDDGSG